MDFLDLVPAVGEVGNPFPPNIPLPPPLPLPPAANEDIPLRIDDNIPPLMEDDADSEEDDEDDNVPPLPPRRSGGYSELESSWQNGVYVEVARPIGKKIIDAASNINKYTARVVFKGYRQLEGVGYDGTVRFRFEHPDVDRHGGS